jgi:hypothetical protein
MIVLTPRQKRAQALNASIEVEWNARLATNIKCLHYWTAVKVNEIKEYRDDNPKIIGQAVKSQLMIKRYREHLAAFRLQRWFHHISTTIHYAFCKRRVNGHYDLYKGNNR